MSRNLKIFSGAAVIFYLVGAMNDAAAVYVLAGICVAVIVGCYWLSRMAVGGLAITMELPYTEISAGTKAILEVRLQNKGLWARPEALVRVPVRNLTIPEVEEQYHFVLPATVPGAQIEAAAEINIPLRGVWEIGPAQLIGTDPLGMFARRGPHSSALRLLALPQILDIPWIWRRQLLSPAARILSGARARQGGEFWGVRPHEPGDELRHVHWKATARRGDLVVKEYAKSRELSVLIWLDVSRASLIGFGAHSSLEMSLSLAASLLVAFQQMDQAVALVGQGLPSLLATPSRGQTAITRLLRALAVVQAQEGPSFAELLFTQTQETPLGHTNFVITTGIEAGLAKAILSLAEYGAPLRCFLLAPDNFLTQEQRAKQERLASSLQQRGIAVAIGRSPAQLRETIQSLAQAAELYQIVRQ